MVARESAVDGPSAAERRTLSRELGVSEASIDLHFSSDVIDLHVDSFIWHRIFGYDFRREHHGRSRGLLLDQFDLPRARRAGVSGATWVITTNPLADARDREAALLSNLIELQSLLASPEAKTRVVRSVAEYRAARRAGQHAAFIGIQGGNALGGSLSALSRLPPGLVLRITLLHLSSSRLGHTSSPLGRDRSLSDFGRDFVSELNRLRILVDLAHISRQGFWSAVRAHDPALPFVVTHTGVSGVHPHWRNLDDEQLRAVAKSGGTVGIMYHSEFLGDPLFGGRLSTVVRHLEHAVAIAGEDHVSLGSDWDGFILTPRDMPTCLELPRLTDALLRARWPEPRIRKILGENFLRVVEQLRG